MEAHTLTNYIPEFITLPLKVREYILTIKQPFEALISIGGNMGLTCHSQKPAIQSQTEQKPYILKQHIEAVHCIPLAPLCKPSKEGGNGLGKWLWHLHELLTVMYAFSNPLRYQSSLLLCIFQFIHTFFSSQYLLSLSVSNTIIPNPTLRLLYPLPLYHAFRSF